MPGASEFAAVALRQGLRFVGRYWYGNQTWQWKIHEDTLSLGDFPIEPLISSGFPIATFDDTGGVSYGVHHRAPGVVCN